MTNIAASLRSQASESNVMPAGTLLNFAGTSAPDGWLLCYGQALNAVTNPEYQPLFDVIGNTYGGSDNTNFVVPDLRGRVPVGKDNMGGVAANRMTTGGSGINGTVIGGSGGTETHALTLAQGPAHDHSRGNLSHTGTNSSSSVSGNATATNAASSGNGPVGVSGANVANPGSLIGVQYANSGSASTAWSGNYNHSHGLSANAAAQSWNIGTWSGLTSSTGSGSSHQNTQPSIIINVIIKF